MIFYKTLLGSKCKATINNGCLLCLLPPVLGLVRGGDPETLRAGGGVIPRVNGRPWVESGVRVSLGPATECLHVITAIKMIFQDYQVFISEEPVLICKPLHAVDHNHAVAIFVRFPAPTFDSSVDSQCKKKASDYFSFQPHFDRMDLYGKTTRWLHRTKGYKNGNVSSVIYSHCINIYIKQPKLTLITLCHKQESSENVFGLSDSF